MLSSTINVDLCVKINILSLRHILNNRMGFLWKKKRTVFSFYYKLHSRRKHKQKKLIVVNLFDFEERCFELIFAFLWMTVNITHAIHLEIMFDILYYFRLYLQLFWFVFFFFFHESKYLHESDFYCFEWNQYCCPF